MDLPAVSDTRAIAIKGAFPPPTPRTSPFPSETSRFNPSSGVTPAVYAGPSWQRQIQANHANSKPTGELGMTTLKANPILSLTHEQDQIYNEQVTFYT
jgi:hypothetical protein